MLKQEGTLMSRFLKALVLLSVTASLAFMAQAASATSGAHFFSATASINDDGALVVTFDEAGVGQQTVNESLSADGTALYACINGGGKHPSAANKQLSHGPVSGSGTFAPTKNGRVSGSLSAGPPDSTLQCPTGQTFVLACVKYTDIFLTDTTNGVTAGDLGPVARTFVNIDGCPIP
jgi:hypothetical protein